MIADRIRIAGFTEALRKAIRPGAVVMDIGTGPGCMAVLACQLGASRVYAIEPCEIIQVGREIAAANHCADKIEFFEGLSTNVTIPVLADVIVSDLRGLLPLFQHHIPSIMDARKRLLAPGGALIARKDRIWAAIVEAPKVYGKIVDPWDQNTLGQDLRAARHRAVNTFCKVRATPGQLLTRPKLWATLDYTTIENPDVHETLEWKMERNGTAHGIMLWCDMELADGVEISNGPASPEMIYGAMFFPWLDAVPVATGQTVSADLEAKLLESDYFWRWTTQIEPVKKLGEKAIRFEQSQLQGNTVSLAKLHKTKSDYVPHLSVDGQMRRRALELMDGASSLEQIARRLTSEFPNQFARWQQALSYAGALSRDYGR